jgi:ABC-2 type transport system permease protein
LAEHNGIVDFFKETTAIAYVELKKLFRDPTELFSRAVQPVLWLVIFGQVFSKVRGIPTGNVSYLAFMTPGILAQSVLFTAIFYGIAVIWERDLGIIHKLLVSPAHRASLVVGKAASAGFRGAVQTGIIYLIAFLMRIEIRWSPLAIAGVLFAVALGSGIFATFSLAIACIVKSRERFMGIGQVLTMPLFFASSAIYPLEMMPAWLRVVARLNPLTYLVDALRGMMIQGGQTIHPLSVDIAVMAIIFVVLTAVASKLYPTLVQ